MRLKREKHKYKFKVTVEDLCIMAEDCWKRAQTSDEDFLRMAEDCWRREDGSDDFNGASDVAGGLVVEGEQFFKILGRGTVATSSHTSLGISIYRRKLHL